MLFAVAALLNADGGAVQFRRHAGPFELTLFSSTSPLRTGPADLSVLIESRQSRAPILDAAVSLRLRNEDGREIIVAATHQKATNKLLYAALPTIPEAGTWDVQVRVARGNDRATVAGAVHVLAGAPAVIHYWPYFAAVPFLIGLFILNQYLKAKQRGR